jgi:hypothetical protein
MKKLFYLALCVLGFILIAAPTAVEHPVLVNGKPFANAVVVQGGTVATNAVVLQGGTLAISLREFAIRGGAPVTLEPLFYRRGNALFAREAASNPLKYKEYKENTAVTGLKIQQPSASMKIKAAPGQMFQVVKAGQISSNLLTFNGETYVPLADVIAAFNGGGGGAANVATFTNLKPGEAIRLNFTKNQNSIIAILIGL